MSAGAQVELDRLAADRAAEAVENSKRALSWGKRKNWCDKAAKLAAAVLAGVAAVLAVVAVPKAWTAAVAGSSAILGALGTMNFGKEAAADYTAAAEYKCLASRYQTLLAAASDLNSNDARKQLEQLALENKRIQKRHAAVV